MNKFPWYKTDIYSKLHGILFEDFITNARIDRYNFMFYFFAQEKKEPDYEDNENNILDRLIPKHVTKVALKAVGTTYNFIGIWLKIMDNNYYARGEAHSTPMKDMFKITTMMKKTLIQRQKI